MSRNVLARIYSVYGLVGAFHGQVHRCGAFEALVHEDGGAPEHLPMARAIGDERQSLIIESPRPPGLGEQGGGIVSPSALAVLRLMISSNRPSSIYGLLRGDAGLAPLRDFVHIGRARRYTAARLVL